MQLTTSTRKNRRLETDKQLQLLRIQGANSETLLDVLATLARMQILVEEVKATDRQISVLAQVQPLHQRRLPILLRSLVSVRDVQVQVR